MRCIHILRGGLIRVLEILVHELHGIGCILYICSFRCSIIDYRSPGWKVSQAMSSYANTEQDDNHNYDDNDDDRNSYTNADDWYDVG